MPIDPSIVLGYKPTQIESPMNAIGRAMQLKALQQQGELGALQMDKVRRDTEENAAVNEAYRAAVNPDGTINRTGLYTNLASRGAGAKLPTIQKGFADQDKAKFDMEKSQLEAQLKKFEVSGQIMSSVRDQASWDQARQATAQIFGAEAAAQMPAVYDPALVEQKRTQALSVKDQLEQKWKALAYTTPDANAVLSAQTSTANNQRSVSASMANAGATREVASATRDAARITSQNKVDRDTELKLQDDYRAESKGFAETSTAMKKVFGAIETADKNPGSALAAGTAFMKILDPNSVVRESELGMALNASGWFDRATNIANTLQNGKVMTAEQKKNLKAAAEDLFEEAKAAQREVDAAYNKRATDYKLDPERIITDRGQNTPRPAPASGPKPGTVQDGYRFKGGNPADQNSWEKV